MLNRLAAIALFLLPFCIAPSSSAADLTAQLFPLTGEVRFVNRDIAPVPLVFYSIKSDDAALIPGGWLSITDVYDASGNGLVDPANNWSEFAMNPMELSEGLFVGPGGSIPAMRAISLGQIWDPFATPFPDLLFDIREPNEQPINVTIELAIDGDYSRNQVVDQSDYVVWRKYLDSTSNLEADGNLNGVIDAGDYLIWVQNFGQTVPLPPYTGGFGGGASGVGSVGVPEPATATIMLGASAMLLFGRSRRRVGEIR